MAALLVVAPLNEFVIQKCAEALGFRVTATNDARIAVQWIETRRFDAVVLGSELSRDTCRFIATAASRKAHVQEVVIAGADDQSDLVAGAAPEIEILPLERCIGEGWLEKLKAILKELIPGGKQQPLDCEVVVVEDLDAPREIICGYVEHLGIAHVHGCRSAVEALEYLGRPSVRPRIVVTDIKMPKMNGCELIRQLRLDVRTQKLPIVALTAYGTLDCLIDALAAGASGFLVKPPKREEFGRELARACRVIVGLRSPRLASAEEAERLRELVGEPHT